MAYAAGRTRLISQGSGGLSRKLWSLDNPDNDAVTVIDTSGYITDARAIGMTVGDMVITSSANAAIFGLHFVQAITAGGAADLTDTPGVSTDTD